VSQQDGYTVTAQFEDVLNVVPRSPVMVSDVPVGQVLSVRRVGWHAEITMRIRKNIVLPDNAVADIRQTSLLGEKYVALLKPAHPSANRLGNGDTIPLSATGRNPEVEEVLGALSFLLSGGGVGQLRTISSETNKIMSGRTDRVRHVLGQLDVLIGGLNAQKGDIISAMASIDRLSSTLDKEKQTVGGAIDAIGPAVRVLDDQHRNLIAMLRQLDKLGQVGTRVLNGSRKDMLATLRHLAPTLRELANAGDSLPRAVALLASYPFPQEASQVVKGDYANALFNLTIDLSQMSSAPTPPGPVTDACKAVKKQVTAAATKAVQGLPLTAAQKAKLRDAIVKKVMGSIDCEHPGNIPAKVAKALVDLLKGGLPGLPPIPLPTSLPSLPGLPGGLRTSWTDTTYADGNASARGGLLGGGL
jgi:phospholipid/cholesterol/gamma-HCH transport system substrate-binding protein